MGGLQRFERRLEGLVEGLFARAFRSEVKPVEIASALQRELDERAQVVSRERALVPNAFTVTLGETDLARLRPYTEPLKAELVDLARDHADEQHYTFTGPVSVEFTSDPALDTGIFRVGSRVVAGPLDPPRRAQPPPPAPAPVPPRPPAHAPGYAGQPPSQPPGHAGYAPQHAGPRPAPSSTTAGVPRLVVNEGGHDSYSVPLTKAVAVIGRAADAAIQLTDPGVSRAHAEIRFAGSHVVLTDLRSTNGTSVNGVRINSVELSDGDRITLGETSLVFRTDGG